MRLETPPPMTTAGRVTLYAIGMARASLVKIVIIAQLIALVEEGVQLVGMVYVSLLRAKIVCHAQGIAEGSRLGQRRGNFVVEMVMG